MRPLLVTWLEARGLPAWIAPDYFLLVGAGSLLGMLFALRLTRRDGAAVHHAARALACAYVGALVGGYLFELLRALPGALLAGDPARALRVGRAAYGGLLFGALAAAASLRAAREPLGPFFDRVAPGVGLIFAFVRTGCFLAGCDWGVASSAPWAVRFPPGSGAAVDHALRGWVPAGHASLPVHPTQLYEALVGLAGAAVALAVLRAPRRRVGGAFVAFVAVYAAGRFAVELLRGDAERGHYLALSTAQWVSLALLAGAWAWWRAPLAPLRRAAAVACAALACAAWPAETPAQTLPASMPSCPEGQHLSGTFCCPTGAEWVPARGACVCLAPEGCAAPTPTPASAWPVSTTPTAPPSTAPSDATLPRPWRDSRVSVGGGLAIGRTVPIGELNIPAATTYDTALTVRLRLDGATALELGASFGLFHNGVAGHVNLGLPAALALRMGERFELVGGVVLQWTRATFESPFYSGFSAFGLRVDGALRWWIWRKVALQFDAVSFNFLSASEIGTISSWEPRLWVRAQF